MQIFYLETNEEVPSIIDRISQSSEKEIALVVPKGALLLQSIVNLKLVKRESEKINKNIVLVTTDAIGRNLASQVGISVFERIERGEAAGRVEPATPSTAFSETEDQSDEIAGGIKVHRYYQDNDSEWGSKKVATKMVLVKETKSQDEASRKFKKPFISEQLRKTINRIIVIACVLLVGLSFGWTAWAWPKTKVTISVRSENLSQEIDLQITPDGSNNSLKGILVEAERSGSKTINSTGLKNIGEKARGKVIIYNEYSSSPQPLQAGTRMQTADNKVYRLDEDVVVPGGTFEVEGTNIRLTKAGSVTANATADQPGESYNISSANLTLPGIGRDNKIYAKASNFTGGISKTVKVVSASDISDSKIDLTNQLFGQAQEEITKKTRGYALIEDSIEKNVTAFSASKQVDEEADSFLAQATVKIRALSYIQKDLEELVTNQIKSELDAEEDFVLNKENLQVEAKNINLNEVKADLHIKAEGKKVAKLDQKELARKLRGRSFSKAEEILRQIPQFEKAEIKAVPSWWFRRIPTRQKSLTLEIRYE